MFRETFWVGGGVERLLAENRGGLVLSMTVARRPAEKPSMIDVGPVVADHPDDVAENAVVTPFLQGFGGGLGKTEIDRACKKLLRAVDLARVQQFLRANDPQLRALFGADQVLAALAARQRKVRRAHVPAAREVGEHGGALVVGVRGDHQHGSELVQFVKRLFDLGRAGERALLRGEWYEGRQK